MSIEKWKFDSLEQVQEMQRQRKIEELKDNKLLREIKENNQNTIRSNSDMFAEEESKFITCSLYDPCPICHKCLNKASHLYVRCETCKIPICTHKYSDREFMIRRDNFKLTVGEDVKDSLKELGDKYTNKNKKGDSTINAG